MNKILLASITFALIAAAPPSAEATTLSFDSILSVGNYVAFVATDQYRESGYQLSLNGPYGFSTVQTNDPRFTGKAAIFNNNGGDLPFPDPLTLLTRIGGLTFSLDAISLAPLNVGPYAHNDFGPEENLTFVGITPRGGIVSDTINVLGSSYSPINYSFGTTFSDVVSVFWVQDRVVQIDSIRVAAAVPEPSTWAMMVLGFGGVGFIAYRRKLRQHQWRHDSRPILN